MNLSTDPWIGAWHRERGPEMLSLRDLFERADEYETVNTGDTLSDAAVWRLLLAIDKISANDGARWLAENEAGFELFDQEAPFFQHPALSAHADDPALFKPVRSIFVDTRSGAAYPDLDTSSLPVVTVVPRLLARIMFGPGGIQPMTTAGPLGAKVRHGTTSVCGPRPLTMWHAETLAATLAANRVPGEAGTFHFTWPQGWKPGDERAPAGQVDALTWPSRVVSVRQDDQRGGVDRVALGMGVTFGIDTDPAIVPHTLYRRDDDGESVVHKLSGPPVSGGPIGRPTWLAILAAWADPEPVGVLAHSRGLGYRIAVTGLHLNQSRIDGLGHETMDEPVIDPADLRTLLEHYYAQRKTLFGAVASATRAASSDQNIVTRRLVDSETLAHRLRSTVEHAAAARISVDEARETITKLVAASATRDSAPLAAHNVQGPALAESRFHPKEKSK